MSDLDTIIGSDFRALRESTARQLPDVADTARRLLGDGDPYRDPEPGAEARARSARDRRLRELALMPLACERVFVHRVSRIAAGATALVSVAIAALLSMDPWTHSVVYAILGQPTAILAGTLLCAASLAAYVLAGLCAELYYERRIKALFEAGDDTYDDLEQLERRGPLDEAHRLLGRVDAAAVALPLAGVISGGLVLGLLMFFSDIGWSALGLIDASLFALAPAMGAGVVASIALGRAASRDRRGLEAPIMRLAEHWLTLAAGGVALVVTLWYALRAAFGLHALGVIPDDSTSATLGVLGVLALALPATWIILWLRRREHRKLGM